MRSGSLVLLLALHGCALVRDFDYRAERDATVESVKVEDAGEDVGEAEMDASGDCPKGARTGVQFDGGCHTPHWGDAGIVALAAGVTPPFFVASMNRKGDAFIAYYNGAIRGRWRDKVAGWAAEARLPQGGTVAAALTLEDEALIAIRGAPDAGVTVARYQPQGEYAYSINWPHLNNTATTAQLVAAGDDVLCVWRLGSSTASGPNSLRHSFRRNLTWSSGRDLSLGDVPEFNLYGDQMGRAMVVYRDPTDSSDAGTLRDIRNEDNVWTSASTLPVWFSTPAKIEMSSNGNAVAAWVDEDADVKKRLSVAHFSFETGEWLQTVSPHTISVSVYGPAGTPAVAYGIDHMGKVLAVWADQTIQFEHVDTKSMQWGEPDRVPRRVNSASGAPYHMILKVAPNGDAVLAWSERSTPPRLWAQHYVAETGWGDAVSFDAPPVESLGFQLLIDDVGSAMLIWTRPIAGGFPYNVIHEILAATLE